MKNSDSKAAGVPLGSGACARRGSFRIFGLDWAHYSWLLYLLFWLIQPMEEPNVRSWGLLAAALAVFLPLYVLTHNSHSLWTKRWATFATALLALVYVPINVSAFGIYIFIASALPELVTTPVGTYWLVGAECALILAQALVWHLPSWAWSIAAGISAVTAVNIQNLHTQKKADARLRMAHDEIEQLAKSAERERIARDLHDVLGHTLSLIAVKSELAGKLLATDPERTARELAEIQTTARRALSEVRQTVSGYRAQGLEAEFQQAGSALAAAGVAVTVNPAKPPRLPAQQEASLSLILREAVTNIIRHAGARTCAITLSSTGEGTVLEVRDDGRGLSGEEGNGLMGIRERVRELGGHLKIHSEAGTVLQVLLPGEQLPTKGLEPVGALLDLAVR